MTKLISEQDKFDQFLKMIIEFRPSLKTSMALINVLICHMSFKASLTDALNTPNEIKEQQKELDEFTVNMKDYMKFKQGRP